MTGSLEVYIVTNYIESIHPHRFIEKNQMMFKNSISDILSVTSKVEFKRH